MKNQQRELISARKMSHEHNNTDMNRPRWPGIASKYKVHKLPPKLGILSLDWLRKIDQHQKQFEDVALVAVYEPCTYSHARLEFAWVVVALFCVTSFEHWLTPSVVDQKQLLRNESRWRGREDEWPRPKWTDRCWREPSPLLHFTSFLSPLIPLSW